MILRTRQSLLTPANHLRQSFSWQVAEIVVVRSANQCPYAGRKATYCPLRQFGLSGIVDGSTHLGRFYALREIVPASHAGIRPPAVAASRANPDPGWGDGHDAPAI